MENLLYKSPGERFLKINAHLQKKTLHLKMYGFYWATLYSMHSM